jgi:hypothetical protein
MKRTRDQLKAELMAEAEEMINELLDRHEGEKSTNPDGDRRSGADASQTNGETHNGDYGPLTEHGSRGDLCAQAAAGGTRLVADGLPNHVRPPQSGGRDTLDSNEVP